VTQYTVF